VWTGNKIPTVVSQRRKLKIVEGAPGGRQQILEVGRSVFVDNMAGRLSAEELIDYVDGLDVILGRSDLCGGEAQIQ